MQSTFQSPHEGNGSVIKGLAILSLAQVKARVGLGRSTIYAKIAQGEFPEQVQLGLRRVGWVESEIDEWLQARIDVRDQCSGGGQA